MPGRVESGAFTVRGYNQTQQYSIYLPPCYTESTDSRYPVLYLLHGQTYNDDQWLRLGAAATADLIIAAGEIAPMILVMPYDRVWTQPSEDPFGKILVEYLVPYIDGHYRTLPQRKFRAIGGLSRGGGWAIHLGFTRWDLFSAVGAHSPVVFWEDAPLLEQWLAALPSDSLPRIFMDVGDREEDLNSALWLEGLLTQHDVPHEWYMYIGNHSEDYWRAHVEEYLRWYAAEWQVAQEP